MTNALVCWPSWAQKRAGQDPGCQIASNPATQQPSNLDARCAETQGHSRTGGQEKYSLAPEAFG